MRDLRIWTDVESGGHLGLGLLIRLAGLLSVEAHILWRGGYQASSVPSEHSSRIRASRRAISAACHAWRFLR
jgi:hypothetical protein